jgi:hypothetical protein
MTIGIGLMIAGLTMAFSGFLFFRHPGVRFLFFGPVWRASQFVKPPGVALWVGGMVVGGVGILFQLFSHA